MAFILASEKAVWQNLLKSHDEIIQLEKLFNNGESGYSGSDLSQAQRDSLADVLSTAADEVKKAKEFDSHILKLKGFL